MALSDNKIIRFKETPAILELKVVSGLIHIYKGAHLAYKSGKIGYVGLAADELTSEYAGIAMEELNVAAADNLTDGTFAIKVLSRGNGRLVEMNTTTTITIANEGDPVYMDTDDAVDIASGIVSSVTNGMVGIIRQYVSANKAFVQMTQHPIL